MEDIAEQEGTPI